MSDPGPPSKEATTDRSSRKATAGTFKANAAVRRKSKTAAYIAAMNDVGIIDLHINLAGNEQTATAKKTGRKKQYSDKTNVKPSVLEKCWGLHRVDDCDSGPQVVPESQEQSQAKGAFC